jgi:hypothetical protein
MRSKIQTVCRTLAPIAGALAFMSSAHATYTVVDADLYPTRAVEGRQRPPEPPAPDKFKVGFTRGATQLGPLARSFVDSLISRMRESNVDRVKIVGHIDLATPTDNDKQRVLAMSRASSLRAYLMHSGVSGSIIEIDCETTGNASASSGISPADIFIYKKADARDAVVAQARAEIQPVQPRSIPHDYTFRYPGSMPPAGVAEPATTESAGRPMPNERLVEYINRAVQTGQMQPTVAAQILQSLADEAQPAPAPAARYAPAQTAAALPVSARPTPVHVERWVLDARLTLRDNLDEWAKASGWNPTIWDASNYYQVTQTTVVDGAFPDVLKRVADSTGLNICVKAAQKVVHVTDANVPCAN